MPVAPEMTPKSPPYVQPQTKLAQAFKRNNLQQYQIVNWLMLNGYGKEGETVRDCGKKSVFLKCHNGHEKVLQITCKKEYCSECGQKDSLLHKRTKTRAYERLLWADVLGYMVFTIPREISDSMPSKKQLGAMEKAAAKIVTDNFAAPGAMARIHLLGENPENLHIHVNVLFPIENADGIGRVDPDVLDKAKRQWRDWINKTYATNYDKINAHYQFATEPGRKKHKIKYVTRPVVTAAMFLLLPDQLKKYCLGLKGFHNTRWYGKLANAKYRAYLNEKGIDWTAETEKDPATSSLCPVCGEAYKYVGCDFTDTIISMNFKQVSKGVWLDLETIVAMKEKAPPL